MAEDSGDLQDTLSALSAEIGRRRQEGLPYEDLVARHRELSKSTQKPKRPASGRETQRQLVVEQLSDIDSAELRDTWGRLLVTSKAFSPSMSWEWAYAWYTHFARGKPVDIRVVRESPSGNSVGLLPLVHVSPRQVLLRHEGYLPCRQLAPVGTRIGAEIDYTHPLIDANCDRQQVIRLLLESLAESGRPLVANHWDGGDKSADLFITQARDLGFAAVTVPRLIAYDSLPGSFGEFIEQVPKTMIRRKLRRYEREGLLDDGPLVLDTYSSPEEITSHFPVIRRFSEGSYGFASIWKLPWFVAFMRSCVDLCAPRGWPVLWVLRSADGPLATVFGWLFHEACFITAVAHDLDQRAQEPGHILLARVVSQLIDRGVKWIDIHTAEGYKTHYFRQRRARYDPLVLCPPGHSPHLALAGMFLIRSMREQARTTALWLIRRRRVGKSDTGQSEG